jgi:putative tryptophan/tyrosine transport system substrate-binding protein
LKPKQIQARDIHTTLSLPREELKVRRREVIFLGMPLAIWPATAFAQTGGQQRRIGFLGTWGEGDAEGPPRMERFRSRLRELGWREGTNLQITFRFGDNNGDRIRQSAAELVALAPDAIVSTTSTTTRALMEAGGNVPIVAAVSGDPIALGFTKNLSHPTANVTGFTTFNDTLAAKRFEMLHEIVPTMRAAALMWVAVNPQQALLEMQTREAAKGRGIDLLSLPIKTADDIPAAFTSIRDQKVSALIVAADPLTVTNGRAIIDACIAMKLPAMHTFASEARNGALMSYGIDVLDSYRRTAEYVDLVLKGTKIANLPFQQPTRFTLIINLKTARAIDVKVPSTLLALADDVIE